MNFEDDLRQQFADWLSASGCSSDGDLHAVVMRYQNITRRIPPQMKWRLLVSDELARRQLPEPIQEGLRLFTEQAKRGEDLRPFVSHRLIQGDFADLLLHDWGVYHFHLGTKVAKRGSRKGFMEGIAELLFAIADPKSATMYLIDILPHEGGFTNQNLLRVVEDNWRELLDRHALKGLTPSFKDLRDEDVELLRKGGINVAYGTPGGRTIMTMGGGITSAKTNAQDVRTSDYLVWRVRQAEAKFAADLAPILTYFERDHGLGEDDVSFCAHLGADEALRVSETATGTVVWHEREGWLVAVIEVDL